MQILAKCAKEECTVLRDECQTLAEVVETDSANVDPVNENLAGLQLDHSGSRNKKLRQ